MFLAIFRASAVTSPEERPWTLAETPMVRLPSECSILEGAFPIETLAIWAKGTTVFIPLTVMGKRSMLVALMRSSGLKRTATSRDSPVGSTQSPTSMPAKATRNALAVSVTEMPKELAKPRSNSICNSFCGSCCDKPTSTAPGTCLSCSMNSLVMVSNLRESVPLNRICTGFDAPLDKSSNTVYSAPTNWEVRFRSSMAMSCAVRLRSVLLPMST